MSEVLNACLAACPRDGNDPAFPAWVDTWAPRIAAETSAVMALFDVVGTSLTDEILALSYAVLDAMRMNMENNEAGADEALARVAEWSEAHGPSLGGADKMGLCQAFMRAGLPVPTALRLGPDDAPDDLPLLGAGAPDIADLLGELLPDDTKGYAAFSVVSEVLSAMPEAPGHAFVAEMIRQAQPDHLDLARFFLLAPEAGARHAAAQGFADLAETRGMDAVLLSDLIQLRKWLPAEASRTTLDSAIRQMLRREAGGGAAPRPWQMHRLMTSLPDGTGSQSVVASVSRGSEKSIATVLIKAGHGIKDAYAIPCASATEQRALLAQIEDGVEMHDVPPAYLHPVLARALGEHLPPAPGFLEVAQMLGVQETAPDAGPLAPDQIADPDALVASLSVQKRGRLIGQSIGWPGMFDIADSWFLSDASLAAALADARTERQAEQAVWAALEAERDRWGLIFARAAEVLRFAEDAHWRSFAAVVLGLQSGRALGKTPIFEMIAALTLDVAEQRGVSALQSPEDDWDDGITPEGKGELARLLKGSPLNGDHLNGYLTAVMIAPEFTTPDVWLPPLMTGVRVKGEGSMQRLLDLVMLRFGAVRDAMMVDDIPASLRKAHDAASWLGGFAQAAGLSAAWPKKALTKDDRKILALIAEAAHDAGTRKTLQPLLPNWLQAMCQRASENDNH